MKVGVALLNWNQYEDTAKCLLSLRQSQRRPDRILVFDNGSADGSAERLKREFPEIEVAFGGENHGFAEGNNRAAKRLLDAGMDLVWILNNDTEVPSDCLGTLVRAMEEDSGIGAVGAKIWFMDASRPLCYAGASFNPWTFNARFRGLRQADAGQFDVPEDVDVLSGCCMLVRAETIRRVGLFHPAFFAYSEDVEWSLRARKAGVRLRYEPRAALWHKMFGASRRDGQRAVPKSTPKVEHLLARNRFVLVRLHTRPGSVRRAFALAYHVVARRLPRALVLLMLPGRREAGVAALRGLREGWRLHPLPDGGRL